jgi:hypothetical protein
MAQGGEVKFSFRLDHERAYAARGVQARPPAGATKYGNPDDWADQRPYGGHTAAGAPKLPAKGGRGLIFASSNEDNSDDNDIVRGGATKPAVRQALAATKDRHGNRTVRANEDDPDDNESVSAGARKLAWLRASATPAELDGGGGGKAGLARAGGKDPSRMAEAIERATAVLGATSG